MRRAKIVTTIGLIVGTLMMVAWPFVFALRPEESHASKEAVRTFLRWMFAYVSLMLVCFVAAAIGAVIVVRLIRAQFRQELEENLKELIEGTLEDVRKRST